MSLADHQNAYQTMLEAMRAHPANEELAEDFERAKAALEIAYLQRTTANAPTKPGRLIP